MRQLAEACSEQRQEVPEQIADVLRTLSTTDMWALGQLMKATLALAVRERFWAIRAQEERLAIFYCTEKLGATHWALIN